MRNSRFRYRLALSIRLRSRDGLRFMRLDGKLLFHRKDELSVELDGWNGHDAFRIKHLEHFCVQLAFS